MCDDALWSVEDNFIDAVGNVMILQKDTQLTGDSLKYLIDDNLAQFRGHVVQLMDKDSNILRTNFLDYNTKDSIAVFSNGASMIDKEGNVIESVNGRYLSREDLFIFEREVNMFSDSLFFRSDTLKYNSAENIIFFGGHTSGWHDLNALKSGGGWYNRNNETFYFDRNVHILTEDYEVWSERLYYNRNTEYAHLIDNVQVLDTVDNIVVMGGELKYWNDPRRSEVYKDPVLVMIDEDDNAGDDGEEVGKRDSLFLAAEKFVYYTQRMYQIDSAFIAAAKDRVTQSLIDPLASKRPKYPEPQPPEDSIAVAADSLSVDRTVPSSDSLATGGDLSAIGSSSVPDSLSLTDSLSVADTTFVAPLPPPDTTTVSFLEAFNNVKIYKEGVQSKCDSLLFCTIDSMARLFKDPIIWYEELNQVTSDSMQFVIRNQELEKGYMLGSAFVVSKEEGLDFYHQIKSPEMIGYFDESQLSRFDAIGGVSMIFFLAEEGDVTTMNQKECRLMMAQLSEGELQRMRYYEGVKSDAFPIHELTEDNKYLKDFVWRGEERMVSRFDLTDKKVRPSIRKSLVPADDFPLFRFSEIYFPGYMDAVMTEIDNRKPLIWVK